MAKLKDKVQNALNEARILILASQVLIGFQFRAPLEPGFERLPPHLQLVKLGALGAMLLGLGFLMAPAAYHRIVERGADSGRLHRFIMRMVELALFPFAVALAVDVGIAVSPWAGLAAGALALFFWYGLELMVREGPMAKQEDEENTSLSERIKQVLTEARVVLPGAQALIGFQFAVTLMDGYERLPASSKTIHLISLSCIALCVIVLMAVPAYHRIVDRGEDTERFHRFASAMILASMPPVALGVAGDFFVVVRKTTHNDMAAVLCAVALLVVFFGLWFGFTLWRREHRQSLVLPIMTR
jgi:hypothetical protein